MTTDSRTAETKPTCSDALKPIWAGEDVWLVGSGPSGDDLDVSLLDGQRVIAVNDSSHQLLRIGHFPAAAVFSLDPKWIARHRDFLAAYPGEKYLAAPQDFQASCEVPGAVYFNYSHDRRLSDDPDTICTGGHSGYGALGVAYHKRARRVFLIGYDLNSGTGNLWDSQYRFWARNYRDTLPQLRARNIEVFNCNPRSAIDAFPYADPASVLSASRAGRAGYPALPLENRT